MEAILGIIFLFLLLHTHLGRIGIRYSSPYCGSKFALESFSDCLRLELKAWNIGVHIIEPSLYRTPIANLETIKKNWNDTWDNLTVEIRD